MVFLYNVCIIVVDCLEVFEGWFDVEVMYGYERFFVIVKEINFKIY